MNKIDDFSHIDNISIIQKIDLLSRCKCDLCKREVDFYEKVLISREKSTMRKDNKGEPERDAERLSEKTPKGEAIV